jgi:hypothetical protein
MEEPMQPHQTVSAGAPLATAGRFAVALAVALVAVFALGVVIGYNSVYRDVAVASLAAPAA